MVVLKITRHPALSIRGGLYDPSDLYVLNTYNVNTGVGYAAKVIGVNIKNKVETDNTVQIRNNVGGVTSAGAIYLGSDDVNQGIFGVLGGTGTVGSTLAEYLTVKGNGNVGIGTNNPSYKLDVNGDIRYDTHLRSTSSTQRFWTSGSSTNWIQFMTSGTSTDHILDLQANNGNCVVSSRGSTPLLLNPSTGGNVGIGLSSPAFPLDVDGVSRSRGVVVNSSFNNNTARPALSSGSTHPSYEIRSIGGNGNVGSTGADDGFLRLRAGGGSSTANASYIDLSGYSVYSGSDMKRNIVFGTLGTERMRIKENGNVGIGTASPGFKLEVNGTSQFNGAMRWSLGNMSHAGYSTNKDWYIRSGNSSGKVILQDTGGNVGIGTSSPTAKLHVNGYMKNNNPCFYARRNTGQSTGVYIFNTEHLDSHNAYNPTNGRFTAPIAGRYVFNVWAMSNGATVLYTEFRKNGSRVYNATPYTGNVGSYGNIAGTIVVELVVNDYIDINVLQGAAYGGGNDHNGFCGYMIG